MQRVLRLPIGGLSTALVISGFVLLLASPAWAAVSFDRTDRAAARSRR
jgi:hypothetical protein